MTELPFEYIGPIAFISIFLTIWTLLHLTEASPPVIAFTMLLLGFYDIRWLGIYVTVLAALATAFVLGAFVFSRSKALRLWAADRRGSRDGPFDFWPQCFDSLQLKFPRS